MKLAIFDAGAIGGYVGGVLTSGGADVLMIGRPRIAEQICAYGMHLTDIDGRDTQLAAGRCDYSTDPARLAEADIIIVAVKSGATAEAAAAIVAHAGQDALVVSFQNGVHNAERLSAGCGGRTVLAAMVPWNVVMQDGRRFHRGTKGALMVEHHPRTLAFKAAFDRAGLAMQLRDDMPAVLWSKLLHNLNNAVNALSGLPLSAQLSNRDYRLCLAACISEALSVLEKAGIHPAQIAKIAPQNLPFVLRLPNFLYKPIMGRSIKVDSKARSSMQDDVRAGRPTEIEDLNGAVVALAQQFGLAAPYNERIMALVAVAKSDSAISGRDMRAALNV
jgi:2-dehydropantoate 2-reductase